MSGKKFMKQVWDHCITQICEMNKNINIMADAWIGNYELYIHLF